MCTASLVSDVLQRGRDVDLLGALVHPVENHVEEDIGPGPAHSITKHTISSIIKPFSCVFTSSAASIGIKLIIKAHSTRKRTIENGTSSRFK